MKARTSGTGNYRPPLSREAHRAMMLDVFLGHAGRDQVELECCAQPLREGVP